MTKGDSMQCDDILDEERASNLARRFAIEDFALKYRTSLHMAETLLTKNMPVVPTSPKSRDDLEARAVWSKAMDRERQNDRVNADEMDEMEEMEVDSDSESRDITHGSSHVRNSFPSRNEEVFHQRRASSNVGHSAQVSGFVQRGMSRPMYPFAASPLAETHNNRLRRQANSALSYRPFIWPYYTAAGYPPYVAPMAMRMFPRGYPILYSTANRESQTLTSHVRHELPTRVPYGYHAAGVESRERVHPTATTESEIRNRLSLRPSGVGDKNRLVIPGERKTLLRAKSLDNSELTTSENSNQIKENEARLVILPEGKTLFRARSLDNVDIRTAENWREKKELNNDIIVTNSHRPSVLVMQSSPSSSTSNEAETTTRSMENLNEPEHLSCEHCTCNDDHEATDSDSTPPTSPRSSQFVVSSDERFSSDSPRSGSDSNREKPHKCHICGRAFRKHSALIIHHRVHSGEKPYKCPECAKQFSICGNLRRHFLIHTGERPYICPECSRAFNNPSHLTRHRRKLHTKTKTEQQ